MASAGKPAETTFRIRVVVPIVFITTEKTTYTRKIPLKLALGGSGTVKGRNFHIFVFSGPTITRRLSEYPGWTGLNPGFKVKTNAIDKQQFRRSIFLLSTVCAFSGIWHLGSWEPS